MHADTVQRSTEDATNKEENDNRSLEKIYMNLFISLCDYN